MTALLETAADRELRGRFGSALDSITHFPVGSF